MNIKEGVSYFPFDYTMCRITDLFFTIVRLVLTVYSPAKQIIHFRNNTKRKILELLCSLPGLLFVSYTLSMVHSLSSAKGKMFLCAACDTFMPHVNAWKNLIGIVVQIQARG